MRIAHKTKGQEKEKNKNLNLNLCYSALLIGALAVGGACIFVLPQQPYSAQENRYLTMRPKLSAEGILSGEVQQDLTAAANDQFPGRDLWMQAATTSQFLLYHRQINGVYIGKDGYLFDKVIDSDLSEKNYAANIGYLTAMKQNVDADVSVMLVPTPGTVLTDELPRRAVLYDAAAYEENGSRLCEADSVRWVETREALDYAQRNSISKRIYFGTDHHWTTYGAYVGAATYLKTQDIDLAPMENFDIQTKSDAFYGTLYSKVVGLPGEKPDVLDLPQKLPEAISIETSGAPADALSTSGTHEMPQLTGIYDLSKLDVKDKYAVYFGGNYGKLTIKNAAADTDRRLLLIKDSYANSMVPYLIGSYAEITMVDLRYDNEPMSELTAQGWDEILVCYEMSNFIKDRNIFKLLR